ncbi:DUF1573 domain-containing protein [bacterium]|nr:DUF1573 domain-containing protein [candidate division CSSED10-310 bacterium]
MKRCPDRPKGSTAFVCMMLTGMLCILCCRTAFAGVPDVEFKSLKYSFGKVFSGETLKKDFTFRNVGDDTLIIGNIKSG